MDNIFSMIEHLPERDFKSGETVIREGQASDGLYFLVSGKTDIMKDGYMINHITEPGAIFGEMSFLLRSLPTASVKAREDCVFKYAESSGDFFAEHPQVAIYVSTILAKRLDSLSHYLVDIKRQFGDRNDHLQMLDEILVTIMTNHPSVIQKRLRDCDFVDD